MTKVCSKCGEEKPATTEYFGKAKANKDGLRGQCKDCIKEYKKQYRKENKEKIKEHQKQYFKQYYVENKEEIKERHKQYYKENKEKINEYDKQWRQENKGYIKEYDKQLRQENKEEIKEYKKQYCKENKEKRNEYDKQWRQENKEHQKQYYKENIDRYRQHNQKRRTLKKRLPHTLTLDQWEKIKDDFNNKCAYCGKTEQEHKEEFNEQLHQEHFIPLSKGGGYTHNNIIPSCRSCNTSKHNTDFFEWYPTYEYYNEEREQFILEYLGYIDDNQQLTFDIEMI